MYFGHSHPSLRLSLDLPNTSPFKIHLMYNKYDPISAVHVLMGADSVLVHGQYTISQPLKEK